MHLDEPKRFALRSLHRVRPDEKRNPSIVIQYRLEFSHLRHAARENLQSRTMRTSCVSFFELSIAFLAKKTRHRPTPHAGKDRVHHDDVEIGRDKGHYLAGKSCRRSSAVPLERGWNLERTRKWIHEQRQLLEPVRLTERRAFVTGCLPALSGSGGTPCFSCLSYSDARRQQALGRSRPA